MTAQRDVLQDVVDLLEEPENWTKGALARLSPKDKVVVAPESDEAECWCIWGAVQRSIIRRGLLENDHVQNIVGNMVRHALLMDGKSKLGVAGFNDHKETTHDDVMRVLNYALEHTK